MSTTSQDRRAQLRAQFDERPREPAVYLLRHTPSGRALLATTPDLGSLRNRLAFGRSTGAPGVLDRRLLEDARRDGVAAFELEVLDRLGPRDAATPDEVAADLATLEALWRERLAEADLY